jgi:RHS repeat-associated protein
MSCQLSTGVLLRGSSPAGNDYFLARYYTSALGRFSSPDWSAKEEPIPYAHLENPQSLNLYAYVLNNPLAKADLDVDQIDSAWKPRGKWIASALESFETAMEVRDADVRNQHLTVVLAFALEPKTRPQGITFHNREELEKAFWSTPPSLYLFRPGGEFWTQAEESKGDKVNDDLVIETLSALELFGGNRL